MPQTTPTPDPLDPNKPPHQPGHPPPHPDPAHPTHPEHPQPPPPAPPHRSTPDEPGNPESGRTGYPGPGLGDTADDQRDRDPNLLPPDRAGDQLPGEPPGMHERGTAGAYEEVEKKEAEKREPPPASRK